MDQIKKIAMLIDMGVCMAAMSMAKVLSNTEIELFFNENKFRLSAQGFTTEEIDATTKTMLDSVLMLKNSREPMD